MPYKLNGQEIQPGRSFKTADGSTVTNQWASVFNTEQLAARGVVWEEPPTPFNTQYWKSPGVARDLAEVKALLVERQKETAGDALINTDWYVTRKSEKDTAIPSKVSTYRDAVRTACVAREGEINGAADMAALETLMKAPATLENGDANSAALTQWPEPLS
jgi:hypothetical protein